MIGNHTYSHMQLTKKNREKFKEELIRTNELLEEGYVFVTVEEILFE